MNIITVRNRHMFATFHPTLRFQVRPCQNMEEVLRISFRHLPYSLLRRCMLVSKGWRKLALEELQTRCSITISHEDHVHYVLQKLQVKPNFRVGKCQITGVGVSLDNYFLHQTFSRVVTTLYHIKLESHVEIQESNLFALLMKLPNLSHLSVTFVPILSAKGNHHSKVKCQLQFPCLSRRNSTIKLEREHDLEPNETLEEKNFRPRETFNDYGVPVYRNIRHLQLDLGQGVTFQLSRIFQVFPALFELSIANVTDEPRKHFKSPQIPIPLKHLILRQYSNIGFSEKLLLTLMRFSNLHLEKLALIFHPPSTSSFSSCSQMLKQFIESQQNSLQSLKLLQVEEDAIPCNWKMSLSNSTCKINNYFRWNFNYSFSSVSSSPCVSLLPLDLPHLKELHVQKPLITNLAQVLNHFPVLEQVSFQTSRHGSNWQGLLPTKLQPHENIRKLEIDFIDSDSFSWLGYCFPSLETLQLGYCEKSLFAVLCKLIPCFNSNVASKTLVSCQFCHGASHEFALEQTSDLLGVGENKAGQGNNNESDNKESLETKPTRKGTGVVTASRKENSLPTENINSKKKFPSSASFHHNASVEECHTTSFTGKQANSSGMILSLKKFPHGEEKHQKKKYPFKRLKLLRIRPCFHLPFEDFVFLQGHQSETSPKQNIFLRNFETEPLSESPAEFSWTMLSSMIKDERFEDFSDSTDDIFDETCSSA